jgi:transposase
MIEAGTIDALSTIGLLESIEALYPLMALIHVFPDNARHHHAKLVKQWLARPGCRIRLHSVPACCSHLNPIKRLWGVMHKNITHNEAYEICKHFADATLGFLRETTPQRSREFRSAATDNFRVINPRQFRVPAQAEYSINAKGVGNQALKPQSARALRAPGCGDHDHNDKSRQQEAHARADAERVEHGL